MTGRVLVPVVMFGLAACGCVTTVHEPPKANRTVQVRSPNDAPRKAPSPTPAPRGKDPLNTDPCATRLHEISGAILLYYAVHRQLPDKLEGLSEVAEVGQVLNFTCPLSGQPYGYTPSGLEYQGREERLVVYDAAPSHDGRRWGILAAPPRGNQPPATWVVSVPEGVFRVYETPRQDVTR